MRLLAYLLDGERRLGVESPAGVRDLTDATGATFAGPRQRHW
jgi:hypothetical protein